MRNFDLSLKIKTMKKLISASLLFCLTFIAFSQHTLVLKNGEKVNGVVMELKDDVLSIVVDRKLKTYPMVQVSSIFFSEYVPYDGKFIASNEEKSFMVDQFTVKYNVKDRTIEKKPKVSIGTTDKGTVVVDITIDKYGNVRSATAGAVGSTTSSSYLYIKAETAAKSAKFDENLTGPLETKGTITIVYP